MPTCATSSECSPISTLWPICTRLSILVPRRTIGVAEGGPVDRGVGADLHVVLDQHAAHLRNLAMGAAVEGEAEAVGAEHGAGVDDRRAGPTRTPSRRLTCG